MNYLSELIANEEIFLKFMKEKYPLFSKSNFFLRDLQYAITNYFKLKGEKVGLSQSENVAIEFAKHLESTSNAKSVSKNTWKLEKEFEQPVQENVEEPVTAE